MVKDVFSRMDNILYNYNKTHKFSGENNHVFLVTPYTALCIREYYESGTLGHALEPLRYKGYRIWKLKGNNDRLILFADVHQAMNTGGMFDESPMWKYFKKKEVRKEMAIDYKKEWEKLEEKYGAFGVNIPHKALSVRLKALMDVQIRDTIDNREKLMEEFVKSRMTTDIVEGQKDGYLVGIYFKGGPMYGKVLITKKEFQAWIKREKGGK